MTVTQAISKALMSELKNRQVKQIGKRNGNGKTNNTRLNALREACGWFYFFRENLKAPGGLDKILKLGKT